MATPIFCCGFECGVAGSVGQHWAALPTGASFDTTTKRNGSRSVKLVNNGPLTSVALTSGNRWVFRFAVYYETSLPSADHELLFLGTGQGGVLFQQSDSKLYAALTDGAGGYNKSSTGITIAANTWYYIDLRVDLRFNPWTCDLQVSGVATTQATRSISDTTAYTSFYSTPGAATATYYLDDVLISQTVGDYPFGDGYVNHFVPNRDGSHNVAGASDFGHGTSGADITNSTTDANTLVDDVPLPSGAPSTTDLISILAPPNAGDYVFVKFGPASGIQLPNGTPPRAVEVVAAIHQAGTGTGNMELRLADGHANGIIYTATGVAGVTSFAYKRAHFATGPSGAAWRIGKIDEQVSAANFNTLGVQIGSPAAVDANPDQYIDAIMIEAEFPVNIDPSLDGRPNGARGRKQMEQLLAT